jgi:hypothetical protein
MQGEGGAARMSGLVASGSDPPHRRRLKTMPASASATPAMANAKPMRSSVPGTAHTMSAATIPANAIINGMYSPVMSHSTEPITTPMARARAPDAMKGARRGSGSARTESVSQMSNR